MEFIAVTGNRRCLTLGHSREMRPHSGKTGSHRVKAFAFSQSEDLELILEAERRVKLLTDLNLWSVYALICLFFSCGRCIFNLKTLISN